MFTGLVTESGTCENLELRGESARLDIRGPHTAAGAKLGDSVAVNGCCLTVVDIQGHLLSFDLLAETLRRTSLGGLRLGSAVNLEPALSAGASLGGHFVQGHVDTTSEILDFAAHGADHRLEIALPPDFAAYTIFKGSICVDGISLTIAELKRASFVCWIIPHTMAVTNLRERTKGELVNLEFDVLAKYVERMLSLRKVVSDVQ